MNELLRYIAESLHDDLACHGLLMQCIKDIDPGNGRRLDWIEVLRELLSNGIEIGDAKNPSGEYVEFIAWSGSVDDRIARATERIANAATNDRGYEYWLCLRRNVDRFEDENNGDV